MNYKYINIKAVGKEEYNPFFSPVLSGLGPTVLKILLIDLLCIKWKLGGKYLSLFMTWVPTSS